MALGGRQLRQFGAPTLALLGAHLDGPQIRIGEVAVIAGAFLATHALGELLTLIPEPGFLHHRFAGLVGLDLALDFVITGLLNRRKGIHVLDFHLRAEGGIGATPHRNIDVTAQGAFLHVAITHA